MESVIASNDVLDKKGFIISSLLLSIFTFIISFTIKGVNDLAYFLPYGILLLGISISMFALIQAGRASTYYGKSFQPSDILHPEKHFFSNERSFKNLLISHYDSAITHDCQKSKVKGKAINIAMISSTISLWLFALIYIYLKICY